MRRALVAGTLTVALLVGAACAPTPPMPASSSAHGGGTDIRGLYHLPDTALSGVDAAAVRLRTGRPVTVLFFGYTNCPDVCTGVLTDLAVALRRLSAPQRERVAVLVVTTDPERDTGPVLREYLRRIDPTFVGLRGEPAQLRAVAAAVGVDVSDGTPLPGGGYEVNHGAQLLAFGSDGSSLVVWSPGTSVGDLKRDLDRLVAR